MSVPEGKHRPPPTAGERQWRALQWRVGHPAGRTWWSTVWAVASYPQPRSLDVTAHWRHA